MQRKAIKEKLMEVTRIPECTKTACREVLGKGKAETPGALGGKPRRPKCVCGVRPEEGLGHLSLDAYKGEETKRLRGFRSSFAYYGAGGVCAYSLFPVWLEGVVRRCVLCSVCCYSVSGLVRLHYINAINGRFETCTGRIYLCSGFLVHRYEARAMG